jgi:hypothetical protein
MRAPEERVLTGRRLKVSLTIVTDGFDGATFHGLFALGLLFRAPRLLEDVGITAIVAASEITGRSFTAEIAINALIVHVKFAGYIFFVFIRLNSHGKYS